MNNVFETFRPKNPIIAQHVHYYYLDVKPQNKKIEFDCYPHFNNSISLYNSHFSPEIGKIVFKNDTNPLQIFTPLRENIFNVTQIGKVHRIVIIFNPLGIHQFYRGLSFTYFITKFNFFSELELNALFSSQNINTIAGLLDQFLFRRYVAYNNTILNNAIEVIFNNFDTITIECLASKLNVSRRHLNRLFNSHFGVSVKKFNKIVLFRKTLEKKLLIDSEQSFTSLAHEFNYFDQSHLTKLFKSLTLSSPKNLIKKGTQLGNEDTFWHLK
ncbi:AraC family transcriptional regulator [Tenacibaculum sp. Mcav3-52]|uniref:HTH araC/xylS-type domain-containing protein n=1 Tax=Tenacibaculum sp. Pbs-1 TaxID=3238748 RepID=A0AB33KYH7_9FLAO|nr:helix-turn-helix domain-containing protein [Tenacibaculum sp. Mcav3-52]MCG7501883.1 AraC family transcriptional regulator [Tenacibaculum sp. Mcav3-52]